MIRTLLVGLVLFGCSFTYAQAGLVITPIEGTGQAVSETDDGRQFARICDDTSGECRAVEVTGMSVGERQAFLGTVTTYDTFAQAENTGGLVFSPVVDSSDGGDAGGGTPGGTVEIVGLVPCGDAGQASCQACHVVDLTDNVVSWIGVVMGTIAALLFMYGGLRLVTSLGNPQAMLNAKKIMYNAIVGLIIVFGCWFFIDFILRALLLGDPPEAVDFRVWRGIECVAQPNLQAYSPYFDLISGVEWAPSSIGGPLESQCEVTGIDSSGNPQYDCGSKAAECSGGGGTPTVSADGSKVICGGVTGGSVDLDGLGQCDPNNVGCSVQALINAGLSEQQANIMSCIAMTESSGIPSTPPYNETNPGSNSSACGTFQITRTTWNNYKPSGSCSDWRSNCQNAACNIQVMTTLVRRNSYSDWTCPNCNSKASGCITKYGG